MMTLATGRVKGQQAEIVSVCRWLAPWRGESPLRLGASRRVRSRVLCRVGRRVRGPGVECVLPGKVFRLGVPLRVRVLPWDHLPRRRYHRRWPFGSVVDEAKCWAWGRGFVRTFGWRI